MLSRVARLSAIHTEIYYCTKCPLHTGRTRTVPGAGDPDAEILFIGEAPGATEDQQGLPFVGKSGLYLDELLAKIRLNRNEVFIANVVKCRPPDNRDPAPIEIEACNPYITEQIAVLDPLIIVTLGRFGMGMFFPNERISQIHGKPKYGERRAYYPLYHPAYALRNPQAMGELEADFLRLPDLLVEMRQKRDAEALREEIKPAIVEVTLEEKPQTVEVPQDEKAEIELPKQKGMFDF
jgi:uracil-DNA glycosylase